MMPGQFTYLTSPIEREWAINDVIEAYEAELNWKKEFNELKKKFTIRNPSAVHEKNRNLREFHEWCPVSP